MIPNQSGMNSPCNSGCLPSSCELIILLRDFNILSNLSVASFLFPFLGEYAPSLWDSLEGQCDKISMVQGVISKSPKCQFKDIQSPVFVVDTCTIFVVDTPTVWVVYPAQLYFWLAFGCRPPPWCDAYRSFRNGADLPSVFWAVGTYQL